MFVKICGITNEDDALFAVAMGADAVGFVFAPSPRQVSPQLVYDITRRLPPEVLTVGVFRDEHPSRVIEIANRSGVKAVQLHGRETPEQTAEVAHSVRVGSASSAAGSSPRRSCRRARSSRPVPRGLGRSRVPGRARRLLRDYAGRPSPLTECLPA
jgi:phosphoribosylanthranilate isomerase